MSLVPFPYPLCQLTGVVSIGEDKICSDIVHQDIRMSRAKAFIACLKDDRGTRACCTVYNSCFASRVGIKDIIDIQGDR